MKKNREQAEFGDFQTPIELAASVCALLKQLQVAPRSVIEPTCGKGSMLLAALRQFPTLKFGIGMDINDGYLDCVRAQLSPEHSAKIQLCHQSFFEASWASWMLEIPEPILVIGNPPWVTNAELGSLESANLPVKANFQKLSGYDAKTGKSNFDISEWMLIQILELLNGRDSVMAMLCKKAVARKILTYAWKNNLKLGYAALFGIDAKLHFNAAVDACLLVCKFEAGVTEFTADHYSHLSLDSHCDQIGWREGNIVSNVKYYEKHKDLCLLNSKNVVTWRSGVKHDCSKIMELSEENGEYLNKHGEFVEIEQDYLYPLLKSSDIAQGRVASTKKWMIVTQRSVKANTDVIAQQAPKTWAYLLRHSTALDARKSSIYQNRARFSVFGIGEYTYAPYKVAISGFYKNLRFTLVGAHCGKPFVFDDTVYFIPCQSFAEAHFLTELLNSAIAREFYSSFVFWDSKRPITIDLLARLDLCKLAEKLGLYQQYDELFSITIKTGEENWLF